MEKVKVDEYEVIQDLNNGVFKCLRNGEEWRDLTGDNLILSLINEIQELREQNKSMLEDVDFLNCLQACGVDNWNGYDEAHEMMREDNE